MVVAALQPWAGVSERLRRILQFSVTCIGRITSFRQCYTLETREVERMTQTVSIDEAPDRLPDLLAQALAGNEVIITSSSGRQIKQRKTLTSSTVRFGR